MNSRNLRAFFIFLAAGLASAQTPGSNDDPGIIDHAECALFTGKREKIVAGGAGANKVSGLGRITENVASRLGWTQSFVPGGSRTGALQQDPLAGLGTIDRNLFGEMSKAGVIPAERTNDFEFIRRVTLDLTGRIPDPIRAQSFLADASVTARPSPEGSARPGSSSGPPVSSTCRRTCPRATIRAPPRGT